MNEKNVLANSELSNKMYLWGDRKEDTSPFTCFEHNTMQYYACYAYYAILWDTMPTVLCNTMNTILCNTMHTMRCVTNVIVL